ncbi:MAG: hypothetical protein RMN25_00835 [Anaerolineae bacterium]|nr:hypothetical protein [Thermoflexales bacterium]MDW8406301.1 hypothetical protein [Anaerolineae bacterium]
MSEETVRKLREIMVAEFSEADLRTLCAELGLSFDELGGLGVFGKTRALIETARERSMLPSLEARARALRPAAFQGVPSLADTAGSNREQRPAGATSSTSTDIARQSPATSAPLAGEHARSADKTRVPLSIRGIAVIVGVLALLMAALTFLIQPRAVGPVSEREGTAPALSTATIASSLAVEQTAPATVQSVSTESALAPPQPAVQPTPPLSATHAAAQTVVALNRQLLEFYQRRVTAEDLREYWRPPAYQVVLDFANRILLRRLGVNLAAGDPIEVDLQYVRPPELAALNSGTATVVSREYWRYTNPRTGRSLCETRDYSYILSEDAGKYAVREFSGELVSSACRP